MNVEMTSQDVLHVIFRHKRKLGCVFALCIAAALIYDVVATPEYAVDASLLINLDSGALLEEQNQTHIPATEEAQQDVINSYKAILQGHDLVLRALGTVGIDRAYPRLLHNAPARMTVDDAAVLAMGKDLFVDNPRSTDLLTMTLINADPHVGLEMMSALIQGFIDKQGSVISNPHTAFLERKASAAKRALQASQDDLQQFRLRFGVSDVGRALDEVGDQRLALDAKLRDAEQTLQGLEMQRQTLAVKLDHSINRNVELYSDDDTRYRSLDDAHTKLTELQLQQSELLRNYAPSSEPVTRIDAQIALVQRTLGQDGAQRSSRVGANPVYQQIQTDVARIEGQIAGERSIRDVIGGQIASLNTTIAQLQQSHGHYLDLQRRYELAEQQYRGYAETMEQAATNESLHHASITNVSVVEPPTFNSKPIRPRRLVNLLMGAMLGLIGGFIVAIIAELSDDHVGQPFQISRKTAVPVLLAIPRISRPLSAVT